MPRINYQTRQKIVAQALEEISFSRQVKQGKISHWGTNEDLYNGDKPNGVEARANVDLGQMASFVHTLQSKIDNPLTFKFTKRKEAQSKRVQLLNSLKEIDQDRDDWDMKDLVGKKQAVMYGRAIYHYSADSTTEYTPHLEPVDVYDFLIDPSAGGIDIEKGNYCGRYGVVKMRHELESGVKAGKYLRTETNYLLEGSGNSNETTQEETNKQNRTRAVGVYRQEKEIGDPDKYKFWEWYTTYEGQRYYLLLCETGATAVRVEPIDQIFESGLYPFWTWAAFPDLTEFWTPSFCDYVREIIMAQAVSINQMLDNAEQINKPQKIVDVGMIENLAELKYRREGIIKVNGPVSQAFRTVETPSIKTPIDVFGLLEQIQEKASGVTAAAKGIAEEERVGIYEGNLANTADRFGYLNKSYGYGYKRFARLWEAGVREHLIKKTAVDLIGPEGVEVKKVSRRDLFRKTENFGLMVENTNAEMNISNIDKRVKINFLNSQIGNPTQSAKKAYEMQAHIAGFTDEEIRQLQDTSEFGTAGLMAEAERDIERLLDGEKFSPNPRANTAYMQRFVDYIRDHEEDINTDQFNELMAYLDQLQPIVVQNSIRLAREMQLKQQMAGQLPTSGSAQAAPGPAPTPDQATSPIPEPTNNAI